MIWPANERSFPMSMDARPVTQTAEAEVKRASTKERGFFAAEKEDHRRKLPAKIKAAKLRTKILSGERNREKIPLLNIEFFIRAMCSFRIWM
jgi:hypothetical protein